MKRANDKDSKIRLHGGGGGGGEAKNDDENENENDHSNSIPLPSYLSLGGSAAAAAASGAAGAGVGALAGAYRNDGGTSSASTSTASDLHSLSSSGGGGPSSNSVAASPASSSAEKVNDRIDSAGAIRYIHQQQQDTQDNEVSMRLDDERRNSTSAVIPPQQQQKQEPKNDTPKNDKMEEAPEDKELRKATSLLRRMIRSLRPSSSMIDAEMEAAPNQMVLELCQRHPQLALQRFSTTNNTPSRRRPPPPDYQDHSAQVTLAPLKFLLQNKASLEVISNFCHSFPRAVAQHDEFPNHYNLDGYPLHVACTARYDEGAIISLLAKSYPPAVSTQNEGGFLPLHLLLENMRHAPQNNHHPFGGGAAFGGLPQPPTTMVDVQGVDTVASLYPDAVMTPAPVYPAPIYSVLRMAQSQQQHQQRAPPPPLPWMQQHIQPPQPDPQEEQQQQQQQLLECIYRNIPSHVTTYKLTGQEWDQNVNTNTMGLNLCKAICQILPQLQELELLPPRWTLEAWEYFVQHLQQPPHSQVPTITTTLFRPFTKLVLDVKEVLITHKLLSEDKQRMARSLRQFLNHLLDTSSQSLEYLDLNDILCHYYPMTAVRHKGHNNEEDPADPLARLLTTPNSRLSVLKARGDWSAKQASKIFHALSTNNTLKTLSLGSVDMLSPYVLQEYEEQNNKIWTLSRVLEEFNTTLIDSFPEDGGGVPFLVDVAREEEDKVKYYMALNRMGRSVARHAQTSCDEIVQLLVTVKERAVVESQYSMTRAASVVSQRFWGTKYSGEVSLLYGLLRESPGTWSMNRGTTTSTGVMGVSGAGMDVDHNSNHMETEQLLLPVASSAATRKRKHES